MIKRIAQPVFLHKGKLLPADSVQGESFAGMKQGEGTLAQSILDAHNTVDDGSYQIKFDTMASHDITYVGIVQTARAGGLTEFPMPYVLTNCHNTLCAVGGTINEDDHLFGLSAAKKYGGIFVPSHLAVIHQYMRERHAKCGAMILASDSHTRYGPLGTMAVGEGGPELVKQLLGRTWNIAPPEIVCVYLTGKPAPGVGPQDVALAIIGDVFPDGFVKNRVMEFAGDGIAHLSVDYRNGIDVMTTETTCLTSIWPTDDSVRAWYELHDRSVDFKFLSQEETALYHSAIVVDLTKIKPMIALPYHPSHTYTIDAFNANAADILRQVERGTESAMSSDTLDFKLTDKVKNGRVQVDQGIIAGCSGGTFENLSIAAGMCGDGIGRDEFSLSIYPASQPIYIELTRNGDALKLLEMGAVLRSAFCGPCFGAGDVPANGSLSIRHTTRNFPNREGSKPAQGQAAAVALMDARSIMATALNGGILTSAEEVEVPQPKAYRYDGSAYENRVYQGFDKPHPELELRMGPNIADWPQMYPLKENLVLQIASVIHDDVTTTDELIPSGETSSLRSNPERLSQYTLSRRDPGYVERAKAVRAQAQALREGGDAALLDAAREAFDMLDAENTSLGSAIFARKPGDGSAREQAASCQKVLGGWANIAREYATKRYRANVVNWGMLPLLCDAQTEERFAVGDVLVLPDIRRAVEQKQENIQAYLLRDGQKTAISLQLPLADDEREILLAGCLINYYKAQNAKG